MRALDGERIRAAIAAAECETTGRIGVRVTDKHVPDALESARSHFHQAGLHEHPAANAVIFLVAPKSRKFAVYGGEAIHRHVGDAFWRQLIADVTPYLANGHPTEGLEIGIARVGEQLRTHFPAQEHVKI